jgi:hypothetical protein
MKTAIQKLEELLKNNLKEIVLKQDYKLMEELFSNALEEEKQQIKTAFESGWNWNFSSEKYYNETYNK